MNITIPDNEVPDTLRTLKHFRDEATDQAYEYENTEPDLADWFRSHVSVLDSLISRFPKA